MSSSSPSKVLIIGGTGAQGLPVVHGLVHDGKYCCRILTRDRTSARAQSLLALGNVELLEGSFTNEADLRNAYQGCDRAFVNLDGFNVGEKGELFWAIRAYELALENRGIQFFVYGNLDYVYKKSGYDPRFRTGHYDGKGRIGEWILAQARDRRDNTKSLLPQMGVAIFTTGPYMEMAISARTPMAPRIEQDEHDGSTDVLTWRVPLGDQGAVPHVALDDCGLAIEHVDYHHLARAFTRVTGHPARYVNVDFDTYWDSGPLAPMAGRASAYGADVNDPASMTVRNNFTGFWTMWQHSGGNRGVIRRNYALLDEIHPGRIRSVEQWFQREDEKGKKAGKGSLWERLQNDRMQFILKVHEDAFRNSNKSRPQL